MNAYINTKYVPRWVSIAAAAMIAVIGILGLLTHTSFAQSNVLSLTGSGVPINLEATPGSVASTDISIRNSGTQTENLKVTLRKFNQDANGNATFGSQQPGDTYFNWVTLSPSTLTLAPNEQKSVRMTINVPKEAAFDYYYAVTFSRASDPTSASGATVNGSLATLVFLNVNVPGAKRELTVTDFSPTQSIYQYLPASFNVKIKNTGNVFAIPRGEVTVNQGNTELARFGINTGGGYVLPGATRTFNVQWNDGFPRSVPKLSNGAAVLDSKGKPETVLDVNWANINKFRIGQYSANLEMVYDNGTRDVLVEKSTTFLVFPWILLLIVLIIVLLLIWAVVNDIIKFEHFLFRKGNKNKSAAAGGRTQLPRFNAPVATKSAPARKKPAVKKAAVTKKPAAKKTTTTRKRK